MKQLKAILPWAILILAVGGYLVRNEVRMASLEDFDRVKVRQKLHWVMHMKHWEEMRVHHPNMIPWSDHIADCWLTLERP